MTALSYVERPEWAKEDEPFIRLSHSTLETLAQCDRKFEIEKILTLGMDREESVHFSFGHAYGAFVQSYLYTQSEELSLLEGWLEYWPIIEYGVKNQETFVDLALKSIPLLEAILEEWDIAYFNDQPAIELSFRINIDSIFYYVGYMDVVLRNKETGQYAVLDVKTTGLQLHDIAPLYKFSGQVIGYSIALDAITGEEQASYKTLYLAGRLGKTMFSDYTKPELHAFDKGLVDRLQWFMGLLQEVRRIRTSMELGDFPRRSSGCIMFNKTCRHYGVCHLTSQDRVRPFKADETEYTFVYDLNAVIEDHIHRVHGKEVTL
jgi:hypothetical protein